MECMELLQEALRARPGAIGACATDADGLLLGSVGSPPPKAAALAPLLAAAVQLVDDEEAVVTVDAGRYKAVVSRADGVVVACFFDPAV